MEKINIPPSASRDKVIKHGNITITPNTLIFSDTSELFQISTINRMFVGEFTKQPFPRWTIAAFIIGIIWVLIGKLISIILGLSAIAIGVIGVYLWYRKYKITVYGLYFQLSAGYSVIVQSLEKDFLEKVMSSTSDAMQGRVAQDIFFSIPIFNASVGVAQTGDNSTIINK